MFAVNGWFIQSQLQILELKIFRKIKFRVIKKFVVTGELKFFDMRTRWPKGDVMNSTACESVQISSVQFILIRSSVEELGRDCCICGYHVYKEM